MCQWNAYVQHRGDATQLPARRQVMLTNQVIIAQGEVSIMTLMLAARSLTTILSVLVTLLRQSEMMCFGIICICMMPLGVLQMLRPRQTAYGKIMRQL